MNPIWWVVIALVIVMPLAYFLGIKAYLTIMAAIIGIFIFVFVMGYLYWYMFVRQE